MLPQYISTQAFYALLIVEVLEEQFSRATTPLTKLNLEPTAKNIARRLRDHKVDVEAGAVTGLLGKLVKKGYVTTTPSINPNGGKPRHVYNLEPAGRVITGRMVHTVAVLDAQLENPTWPVKR
jgi:DNA-binding PadR family transcriptional regulator